MGNSTKKIKDIEAIVIIVLAVLLIGVLVFVGIRYFMSSTNNSTSNLDDIYNEENNQEENKNDVVEKEQDKENEFDPYANYKNMTWGSNTAKDTRTSASVSIENGKVYATYNGKKTQVTGVSGTPIKVLAPSNGSMIWFDLLTKEGKQYSIEDWDTTATFQYDLCKYNVIDMTYINNHTMETIYYLTSDGKLIDRHGVSYDKYSFAASSYFNLSDSRINISFDKNLNGYYYNTKNNTYTTIVSKSTGAKLAFSKIYSLDEKLLIVTSYNKLFEYDGTSDKATQITGDVSSVKKIVDGDDTYLLITFKDGTTQVFKNVRYCYDVKKGEAVEIKEGTAIATISMYKRKNEYGYYGKTMMLSNEQIEKVEIILSQMQYKGVANTSATDDMYKLIIKYKSGAESVLKVYAGSIAVLDNKEYFGEGQDLEMFDTISSKYEWENTDISNAVDELEKISEALQQQIIKSYDGKKMTGSEVIRASKTYEDNEKVLLRIIVDKDNQYQLGKYGVGISDSVLATLTKPIQGGINVYPTDNGKYAEIKSHTASDVEKGVSVTDVYYAYLMKDTETQNIMGLAFVRAGAIN